MLFGVESPLKKNAFVECVFFETNVKMYPQNCMYVTHLTSQSQRKVKHTLAETIDTHARAHAFKNIPQI